MKQRFDDISQDLSKHITREYSTSFSLGIRLLSKKIQPAIYGIYGFVRLADEIVDTFHGFPQDLLLEEFMQDTYESISRGISTNPVLNSFQKVVNEYNIEREHIEAFFQSMEMDLDKMSYNQASYKEYIVGSAEVVGLMCLKIFCEGDEDRYNELLPPAARLGAAFQKVNFLRDLNQDYYQLGRMYFPGIDISTFNEETKRAIEQDIEMDFAEAWKGIMKLPKNSKLGVLLAYKYFKSLLSKIKSRPAEEILKKRIRIPNNKKMAILLKTYMGHQLKMY